MYDDAMQDAKGLRRIGYRRARLLLLGLGVAVLAVIALLTYIRRVEPVEVAATLLFIPIFIAVVLWGTTGGVVAGALAAVVYGMLRLPAIDAVGIERFAGLLISRSAAFVAFGALGGWATRQLQSSLDKLELYDQIDDETGLFNARFFLEDTDLEISRAQRYRTFFSIAIVDIPEERLASLSRRRRKRLIREVGRDLPAAIRKVDRAAHVRMSDRHRFAVILPETAREGAGIFTGRLGERIESQLPSGAGEVVARSLTLPDDMEALQALREDFAAVDRAERPQPAPPADRLNP